MPFDPSQLELYPTQPGVYLMKNQAGDVLYVGKAKNLRSRLKQYFLPGGDSRPMIPLLIHKTETIDTILVLSEKEALLLENNLIKQYRPKYNALLKDDKSYIALKVNHKNSWPMVNLVRYKGKPEPDGLYFGPYTSAEAARATLDLLHRIFPLRQCSDKEFSRRIRPCILYDMKRCLAPCVQKCTPQEYHLLVEKTVKFLKGQNRDVIRELYQEMEQASAALEFEKAGSLLKTIQQLEKTVEGQGVDKPLGLDSDVIGIFRQGEEVIITKLQIRDGKLLHSFHFDFSDIAQEDGELLESFLIQHYEQVEALPHEILLSIEIQHTTELSEILSSQRSKKLSVYCPQRGEKKNLITMALLNAEAVFQKRKDKAMILEKSLLELQERFRLTRYPKRIECFDNSNISGNEPVSCLVAFTDGVKEPNRYRKFHIKTVEGPNDYATFYEVLMRQYKKAKEQNHLPDLVIIDGGKGHLNVALRAFMDLNIVSVDVISVAKEKGRHDKGMTVEQVFLPNVKDPVILRHTSPALFLLQQIRDEAHRFSITFHRARRSKKLLRSELTSIPGIGSVKSRGLLKFFGSVQNVKDATEEELHQVKGLSQKDCHSIFLYFEKKKGKSNCK